MVTITCGMKPFLRSLFLPTGFPPLLGLQCVSVTVLSADFVLYSEVLRSHSHGELNMPIC